ncbi:MAG: flagellar basal body rod protein [Rubrivivax sp.]|nr:MAG: flagellar basal body rod protein [Rubrivivax sp.]
MSAAATAPADAAPKGGKKKLIIIIVAVLALLVVAGGGAAVFMMKKHAADAAAAEEGGDEDSGHDAPAKKPAKEHKAEGTPPVFVPLDPFTVNLADRDADRYAQVGINLQVDDPHVSDELKNYMPAIRNSILLILAHKTSEDLLNPEGKQKLAEEIRREAARAMGYDVPEPEDEEEATDDEAPKKKKKKKKKVEVYNPIVHVHYANFIIQ